MATTSKQYKAIGEDLWKGRTEKIASPSLTSFYLYLLTVPDDRIECRTVCLDIRCPGRAAHQDYEDMLK